LFLGLLI